MLKVENLSGGYHRKQNIFEKISFELNSGDILCVLGPNGCGKTTLFKVLLGLLPRTEGRIMLGEKEAKELSARELAKQVAYIPQAHVPAFQYTVMDMVLLGRAAHLLPFSSPTSGDRKIAEEALTFLGIDHLKARDYTKLSGGERQLVLIARAICQQAKILIMDEPSSSLDYANQQLVMKTILELSKKGFGILLSTHSPDHPFRLANKALLMKNGQSMGFGRTTEVLSDEMLKNTYGIPIEVVHVEDRLKNKHSFCLSL